MSSILVHKVDPMNSMQSLANDEKIILGSQEIFAPCMSQKMRFANKEAKFTYCVSGPSIVQYMHTIFVYISAIKLYWMCVHILRTFVKISNGSFSK